MLGAFTGTSCAVGPTLTGTARTLALWQGCRRELRPPAVTEQWQVPLGTGRVASAGHRAPSTWHALEVCQPFTVLASSRFVIIPRGNVPISKMRKLILRAVEKLETARKWLEMLEDSGMGRVLLRAQPHSL